MQTINNEHTDVLNLYSYLIDQKIFEYEQRLKPNTQKNENTLNIVYPLFAFMKRIEFQILSDLEFNNCDINLIYTLHNFFDYILLGIDKLVFSHKRSEIIKKMKLVKYFYEEYEILRSENAINAFELIISECIDQSQTIMNRKVEAIYESSK